MFQGSWGVLGESPDSRVLKARVQILTASQHQAPKLTGDKTIRIRYRKAVLRSSSKKSSPGIFVSRRGQKYWRHDVSARVISLGQSGLAA